VGKPNRSSGGFSTTKPGQASNQQVAKNETGQAAKEQQAIALINQGRIQEAEAIYRKLITEGSRNHIVYGNLAAICGMQCRHEELIDLLKKTLELKPDYPEAHYNLGIALREQGDQTAAIASFNKALQLKPHYPEAHYNLAIALKEQGEPSAAIASYNTALHLKPNYPEAHINLGNALQAQGDLTAAIASYNTALQLRPDYPEAHINLGNALQAQGDLTAAIASYNTALQLRPDYPKAQWNYSLSMLLSGDYKNGWEKYEWRFKRDKATSKPHALPKCSRLNDENLPNKQSPLLLVTEQGLGDTLQFMRYAEVLRKQGFSISLCAQPKLHTLIQTSGIDPSPITQQQANQVTEGQWIPLLSVPKLLGVGPNKPIITEPYIKTTEELISKWAGTLEVEQRPIIGINWQGNPKTEEGGLLGRSLQLESFTPITDSSQISLLSLQKGFGSEQLETCSFKDRFVSCQNEINDTWDFLETAAIIANCDLVITSDTSIAHLAGGMGKTTWLLLHKVPDWRWGLEGDTSFWYPSMRLFRQRERGNWDEVMNRLAQELQKHFGDTSTPQLAARTVPKTGATPKPAKNPEKAQNILAPISLGELIDKITILQIKNQHLQDTALEDAKKELDTLETCLNNLKLSIDPALTQRLKEVNQELWKIEEEIRDQERQKTLGKNLIHLTRSIYQQNDRRAAIKKEINTTYGSAFTEGKSCHGYEFISEKQPRAHISHSTNQWETVAITLEPEGQRFKDFVSNNSHLDITPFQAARGIDLSKKEMIKQGLASKDLVATSLLTPGAAGCAASHRAIWKRSSKERKGFFVMEDDCYTHPNINGFISTNAESLMNADICFFGINTDSILESTSPTGLTSLNLFQPKYPTPEWIKEALSKTVISSVVMHKLIKAFGTCAYFISPQGARKLDSLIFPLSLRTTKIPLVNSKMPAITIDYAGCGIYAQLNAMICKPFLAYTPNTDSSTKGQPT
jgi:tetratricopeptide (TPR) repeat protein/GR25 family glycosyltransferase involved in LPS biosynthesis